MRVKPLWRVLTLQSLLAIILPFGSVVLLGSLWLLPQIRKDIETRQIQLARAVGMQVQSHFESSASIVKAAASMIRVGHPAYGHQHQLDALLRSTEAMSCLYIVGPDAKVSEVALKKNEQPHRIDIVDLSLSGNPILRDLARNKTPRWSKMFLSVINGGLTVGYGVTGDAMTVIGEVDLALFTKFLQQINTEKDNLILIVDHNGQVVADSDGIYTAQQLNIGNIPMVRVGIDTDIPTTERFIFAGKPMTGSIVQIPAVDWHVLVAKTDESLYSTSREIIIVVLSGISFALICGMITSIYLARRLASRFGKLTRHAEAVAAGAEGNEWPSSTIAEFSQLSDSLRLMNATLHKQEAGLRESEESQRLILNSTFDGIYGIDTQGDCIFANEACIRMLGYERQEELLGRNIHELIHHTSADGTALPSEKCRIQLSCRDGAGVTAAEELFWRRDGSSFPVECSASPIWKQGTIAGAVISWRDVTERKRGAEEKDKLELQLQQAQKMESVGRLAGGIAHDFNNLLTVILCHGQLALMKEDPSHRLYVHLTEICTAAERSAALTKQLLAFARKQTVAPLVLDLNEVVVKMLDMLQRLIGENIQLTWQPKAGLWPVNVDVSQIEQILANLCVNARDAIADVGRITIETGNSSFDAEYCAAHLDVLPGDYVCLAVSDNGCGMDRETQNHIFEPFFTTKGTGKGTGLGLAMVYGIVKQNHGFLNVYSEPGCGTSFTIYLPRHGVEAGQPHKDLAQPSAPRGHETILLVEDESAILQIAETMLAKQGYLVLAAGTPAEAIRLARERSGEIHLLITDVIMPEMNGKALADNLRSFQPQLKILFMSGYTADIISHHGVLDDGVHFLQKPFSLTNLVTKVREVLDS